MIKLIRKIRVWLRRADTREARKSLAKDFGRTFLLTAILATMSLSGMYADAATLMASMAGVSIEPQNWNTSWVTTAVLYSIAATSRALQFLLECEVPPSTARSRRNRKTK